MFDLGFSELLVVAVVALLVLGPERLPKAARFTGLWVRKARAQWYSVKSELENELADDDLKRSLAQARADLAEARSDLQRTGSDVRSQFEGLDPDRQPAIEASDRNPATDDAGETGTEGQALAAAAPAGNRDSAHYDPQDDEPPRQYEDWLLEDSDVHAPSDHADEDHTDEHHADGEAPAPAPVGDPDPGDATRGDPPPDRLPRRDPDRDVPLHRDPDPVDAPRREPDAPPPAAAGR